METKKWVGNVWILEAFGWACAVAAWIGGKPSFEHDIRSFAQAGDVVGGHAAVRHVVGVEAQVLQVGEVGRCDVLAETWQVELCKESTTEANMNVQKACPSW